MSIQFYTKSGDELAPDGKQIILNKGDTSYIKAIPAILRRVEFMMLNTLSNVNWFMYTTKPLVLLLKSKNGMTLHFLFRNWLREQ